MSLFGSLYVGASGLQTGQNALNTTAHNLSNVDTKGYTRQQTLLTDKNYNLLSVNPKAAANQQTGLGVTYADVRQVRDSFLDQKYRKESAEVPFMRFPIIHSVRWRHCWENWTANPSVNQ